MSDDVNSPALGLLLGGCGAVAAVLAWWALVPMFAVDPSGASMSVRLGQGSAALLPGVAALALMILAQMALRVASGAIDPLAGTETRLLRVNQRAIGNTLEQFALFAPSVLALSAGITAARMPEVMAAGVVFAGARVLFWLGYLVAPTGRSFGMAATLVVTLGTLAAAFGAWLR
jgi:uncharacterized membrane protein YecN with MAPEG domain